MFTMSEKLHVYLNTSVPSPSVPAIMYASYEQLYSQHKKTRRNRHRLPVILIYLLQQTKHYLNSKWVHWLQQVLLPPWQSAYLPACSTGQYWGHNAPCWYDVYYHQIHPQHRSYLWKKQKISLSMTRSENTNILSRTKLVCSTDLQKRSASGDVA